MTWMKILRQEAAQRCTGRPSLYWQKKISLREAMFWKLGLLFSEDRHMRTEGQAWLQ